MEEVLFAFERINETTWAYLSSFLMIALFFKFNRFWSIRNLDLLLIILLAPGILMVYLGQHLETEALKAIGRTPDALVAATPDSLDETGSRDESTTQPELEELRKPTDDRDDDGASGEEDQLDATQTPPSPAQDGELVEDNSEAIPSSKDPRLKLQRARNLQAIGFYWLFVTGLLFLVRLIWDNSLIRRPLLESNLTIGGLVFLGCTLMIFLFLNVVMSDATPEDIRGVESASKLLQRKAAMEQDLDELLQRGPGYPLFSLLPAISSRSYINEVVDPDPEQAPAENEEPNPRPNENTDEDSKDTNQESGGETGTEEDSESDDSPSGPRHFNSNVIAAKTLAILSQFAIVLGLIMIGYWHFNNFRAGVEAATIYLILPYTAIYMGHVMHALPAALLVWAVAAFKRPFVAGLLIGFSVGVSYYPLFLLILWISFYWEKGKWPFIYGVLTALGICTFGLIFTSVSFDHFVTQLQRMLGAFAPRMKGLGGIWQLGWDQWYRMPLLAGFIAFSASFAFWPVQKNIGALVSCSAAIMVALQFWHGMDGGTYLAYYMPLTLIVFLRPNVDGRDAVKELV